MGFWEWLKKVIFNKFGQEIYDTYNKLQDKALEEVKKITIKEVEKALNSDRFNKIIKDYGDAIKRKRLKDAISVIVKDTLDMVVDKVNEKMDKEVIKAMEEIGIVVEVEDE